MADLETQHSSERRHGFSDRIHYQDLHSGYRDELWEQGLVDLDAPANDYLRAYRLLLAKANWRHATIRHLLTHTAGVPEWVHPFRMVGTRWFGKSFPAG